MAVFVFQDIEDEYHSLETLNDVELEDIEIDVKDIGLNLLKLQVLITNHPYPCRLKLAFLPIQEKFL